MKVQKYSMAFYASVFAFILIERASGAIGIYLFYKWFDLSNYPGVFFWCYQALQALLAFGIGMIVARWELMKPWEAGSYFSAVLVCIQLYRQFRKDDLQGSLDGVLFLFLILAVPFAFGMFLMRHFRGVPIPEPPSMLRPHSR